MRTSSFFVLINYSEFKIFRTSNEEPDTDVINEKNFVKSLDPSDYFTYNLLLNDLTKYYDKFLAVDHLSLTVKRYK